MDNTELHYLTYDPDAIMDEMVNAYTQAGGETLYPGDEKTMLLNCVLAVLTQAFAGVDNALRMATLRYATGDYLDVIGETRLCPRTNAKRATAKIDILEDESGERRVLEAGLTLVNDDKLMYVLAEDVVIYGSGSTVEATIVSDEAGAKWNALKEDMEMYFLTPQIGVMSVFCSEDAKGGMDEETDDEYRERIRLSGAKNLTTGTALQYESAAKAASTDVLDVQAVSGGAGVVNVYLLIDDDAEQSDVVRIVRDAINSDQTRPLTDTLNVSQAVNMNYDIYVNCYADMGSDIANAIYDAKEAYIAWQDAKIGRAFNPDKLIAYLYRAGCDRVVIDTGRSRFDGGSIQYTDIGSGKVCKGTVNITRLNA